MKCIGLYITKSEHILYRYTCVYAFIFPTQLLLVNFPIYNFKFMEYLLVTQQIIGDNKFEV